MCTNVGRRLADGGIGMKAKEILKGQAIYENGQKNDKLYMIMRGVASVTYPGGRYLLHAGDVLGLCEVNSAEISLNYQAEETLSVIQYPYQKGGLAEVFEASNDAVRYFLSSFFRQFAEVYGQHKLLAIECNSLYEYIVSSYEDYQSLCEKHHVSPGELSDYEELEKLTLDEDIPSWIGGYYSTLEQMMTVWDQNKTDMDFICGFLLKASDDILQAVSLCNEMEDYKKNICRYLMNENDLDLLELFTGLYGKLVQRDGKEADSTMALRMTMNDLIMQLETQGYDQTDVFQKRKIKFEKNLEQIEVLSLQPSQEVQVSPEVKKELAGSLEKILEYADCDEELKTSFRGHILTYKKTLNKNGTEDDIRILRQEITAEFYKIYVAAFQNSVRDGMPPTVMMMFFQFGYVDEELAGMQNAVYLYQIARQLPTAPDQRVYSFYEWLTAIYEGRKEPGRNEFDLDYGEYLHEQKRAGKITQTDENQLLQNNAAKVMYELENAFPSVNKMTFGRISTFCPVFSEHNVLKPLDTILVSEEKISKALNAIRRIDYSAYYRETVFSKPEDGITREFVNVEILPDIILMPNVGTRGVMWQEIEGKRRTTPARMMGSIFQLEDLTATMIRLTGEFRWEMCKRVQGARWNDIAERSLTSEYFDYVQFYKKNPDLSVEARDKMKTEMLRAKNSFKEMFLRDYMVWILYESNGIPRLNKVARAILYTHCPFSFRIREKLQINPLYKEIAEKYNVRIGQKKHRMENLLQKLRNLGKPIPPEIQGEKLFLDS